MLMSIKTAPSASASRAASANACGSRPASWMAIGPSARSAFNRSAALRLSRKSSALATISE
jgi:hypothetical protein